MEKCHPSIKRTRMMEKCAFSIRLCPFAVVQDQWWYTGVTQGGYFLTIMSYQTVAALTSSARHQAGWMLTNVIACPSGGQT